jgi:hypothetical protein
MATEIVGHQTWWIDPRNQGLFEKSEMKSAMANW